MRNLFVLCVAFLWMATATLAQVSISTNNSSPDNSAMLDVISTTKGVLIPRMSAVERTNITNPVTGLLVYQTNETAGFYYCTGTAWQYLPASNSISAIRDANGDTKVQTEKNTNEDNIRFDVGGNERMVLYNGRLHLSFPLSNTYIGNGAGSNSTDGYENLFVGYSTGYSNSTGYNNMFLGAWCGYANTEGYGNAFAGFYSGGSNSTGNANSFFGQLAGSSNGTGSFNSFFGESTGSGIDGSNNSFFGAEAGLSLITGSNNILLGYKAGENLTTGSGNIIIGTDVDAPVANANNQLVIGASDLFYGSLTNKRIGIGNPAPDASAMLDVQSTSKGALLPRMTLSQRNAIVSPAEGLMVFCTNCGAGGGGELSIYANVSWFTLSKQSQWHCGNTFTIDHTAGTVAPVSKTVTYSTVTNIPGELTKCWITQNLGADHQANAVDDDTEASAGWYWQFNRMQGYMHDGTTRTPNTIWITSINENSNWVAANDPCTIELGTAWRIPTHAELVNVKYAGGWTNWTGPWSSGLKIHAAGYLVPSDGSLGSRGSTGTYWSSEQCDATTSYRLLFNNYDCGFYDDVKPHGFSIRCLRDN